MLRVTQPRGHQDRVSRAGTGDARSPGFWDLTIKNDQKFRNTPPHSFSKHHMSLLGLCSTPGRCGSHGKDRTWDSHQPGRMGAGNQFFKSISLYQLYVTLLSQSRLWSKIHTRYTHTPWDGGECGFWAPITKLGFPKTLGKKPKSYQQKLDPHKAGSLLSSSTWQQSASLSIGEIPSVTVSCLGFLTPLNAIHGYIFHQGCPSLRN